MNWLRQRSLLLGEQVISSIFNFFVVVALSQKSQLQVASFGLIYSFALVYSALLKNGALNIYLTAGEHSFRTLNALVMQVVLNRYYLLFFLCVLSFSCWKASPEFMFVFVYYAFVDIYKTYLFATARFKENLLSVLILVIIFATIYLSEGQAIYAFLFASIWLIVRYVIFFHRDKTEAVNLAPEKLTRNSFLMTLSYTTYSHGPLWLLYLVDATLAAVFVQIRNIFQPAQILSRVVDIFEKKSSSQAVSYYANFKRVFLLNVFILTFITLVLAILGYLFFENLYSNRPDTMALTLFLYALVCVGTFVSRPIETFFYGIKRLDILVRTRIIATCSFALLALSVLFVPAKYALNLMLAGLSIVWLIVNITNYLNVKREEYSPNRNS